MLVLGERHPEFQRGRVTATVGPAIVPWPASVLLRVQVQVTQSRMRAVRLADGAHLERGGDSWSRHPGSSWTAVKGASYIVVARGRVPVGRAGARHVLARVLTVVEVVLLAHGGDPRRFRPRPCRPAGGVRGPALVGLGLDDVAVLVPVPARLHQVRWGQQFTLVESGR